MDVTVSIPDEKYILDVLYEPTGEYRNAGPLEVYLNGHECLVTNPSTSMTLGRYFIYKPARWRAKLGESYWTVSGEMPEACQDCERGSLVDTERYKSGNYFKTKEEAEVYTNHILKLFQDRPL